MEDRCVICGADVSDQSRQYCLGCKMEINDMSATKQLMYQNRLRNYIRWINKKPSKWKCTSYIRWLSERPPRP